MRRSESGHKRRKTIIKSGKLCTADTTVIRRVTWFHELVYRLNGQPTNYDELPLLLFISGYLAVLELVKPAQI